MFRRFIIYPSMIFDAVHYPVWTISKLKPFIASVKHLIWSKLLRYERLIILDYLFPFVRNSYTFNLYKIWEISINMWDVLSMHTRIFLVNIIIFSFFFLCCKLFFFHTVSWINFFNIFNVSIIIGWVFSTNFSLRLSTFKTKI